MTNGRQLLAKQRADAIFEIYCTMRGKRSLTHLQKLLADRGLVLTLNTLKNYSAKYDWQVRLARAHEMTQAHIEQNITSTLVDMNERQATLGELAQTLSKKGMWDILSSAQRDVNGAVNLSGADVTRLMAEGSRLERLARGEVTTRTEARIHAYSEMVTQIVQVFANVSSAYQLPQAAIDDFARGADAIVNAALVEQGDNDN